RELRILATSQTPLGSPRERVWRVPTLSLPSRADLSDSDAVALFVVRAAAALPGFRLTGDNSPSVAEVCRQVDGLALAIELAAARVPLMGVDQIAARLGDQLRVLGIGRGGSRSRHGTL